MKIPDISRDPPRDEELAAWLVPASEVPADPRSLDALRAAIRARAELPLARLRRRGSWWDHAARWARPAIPVATAAAIALIVLVGSLPSGSLGTEEAGLPQLEEALAASLSDAEYQLLAAADPGDALLRLAIQEQ